MLRTSLLAVLAGLSLPAFAQSAPVATRTKAAPQRIAAMVETTQNRDVSTELAQVRKELAELTKAIDRLAKALGGSATKPRGRDGAIAELVKPRVSAPSLAVPMPPTPPAVKSPSGPARMPGAVRLRRTDGDGETIVVTPMGGGGAVAVPGLPGARVRAVLQQGDRRCAPPRAAIRGRVLNLTEASDEPSAPPRAVRGRVMAIDDVTDAPAARAPKAPREPKAPAAPKAPKAPRAPKAPKASDAPEAPEAPAAPPMLLRVKKAATENKKKLISV